MQSLKIFKVSGDMDIAKFSYPATQYAGLKIVTHWSPVRPEIYSSSPGVSG